MVAALCMGATAGGMTPSSQWSLPRAMIGPLVYWVLVASVAGYFVVTWAMQHLPASQVTYPPASSLTTLQ